MFKKTYLYSKGKKADCEQVKWRRHFQNTWKAALNPHLPSPCQAHVLQDWPPAGDALSGGSRDWWSLTGRNRPLGWVSLGAVAHPGPSVSPNFPALFSSEQWSMTLVVRIFKLPLHRQLLLEKPMSQNCSIHSSCSFRSCIFLPSNLHVLPAVSQGGSLSSLLCSSSVQQLDPPQDAWEAANHSPALPLCHLIIYWASSARKVIY